MKTFMPGEDEADEIKEIIVERVDLVNKSASGKVFTLLKSEDAAVECENCNTMHSAEKLRNAATLLNDSGMEVTCECGEKIVVEVKKDEEDATKKKAEEEAKAKEAAEKKKKEDEEGGEKTATDRILESLDALKTENENLKEKNKGLETENQKKEDTIKELNEKVELLQKEKAATEVLATEAMELADKLSE